MRGVIENERRLMRAVRELPQQAPTLLDTSEVFTVLDATKAFTLYLVRRQKWVKILEYG